MFFNNKFNTFFGLNLTLVYTLPMCMTWRFHFPLRNYDFNSARNIKISTFSQHISPDAFARSSNRLWTSQNVLPDLVDIHVESTRTLYWTNFKWSRRINHVFATTLKSSIYVPPTVGQGTWPQVYFTKPRSLFYGEEIGV